jgi:hypothetical protein
MAVPLCTLPWLGFVPDEVASVPLVAVERLAHRLGVTASDLVGYGAREQTRTDHLRMGCRYLGWGPAGPAELKDLDEFLLRWAAQPAVLAGLFTQLTLRGATSRSRL